MGLAAALVATAALAINVGEKAPSITLNDLTKAPVVVEIESSDAAGKLRGRARPPRAGETLAASVVDSRARPPTGLD